MPFGVGPMEIVIVLIIALVVLGPKRIPESAKALGRGMREFKGSLSGGDEDADSAEPASAHVAATADPETRTAA